MTSTLYSQILNSMSELLYQLFYSGDFDDVLTVIESGSDIANMKAVPHHDLVNWQLTVCDIHIQMQALGVQDIPAPLNTLRSLETAEMNTNQQGRQRDLIGNALYFEELGRKERDFTETRDYLNQSIDILHKLDQPQHVFWPLFHMGLTYQFDANYDKAMDYFRQAEDLARNNNLQAELSYAVRHIGFIHYFQENITDALTYLKESLALREEIDFKVYLSLSNIAIADVYQSQNEWDNARPYFEQALSHARNVGIIRPLMVVLNSYAAALRANGDASQALAYLQEALSYAEILNHEVAKNLINQQIESIQESLHAE